MPDPRAPRRARLVLWGWAIASLLSFAYVGLLFLASVPADAALGAAVGAREGDRLLVTPVEDPAREVRAFTDANATRVLGARGDVLTVHEGESGTSRTLAPFTSGPDAFTRALAFIEPAPGNASANGTGNASWHAPALAARNVSVLNLTGIPVVNATTRALEAENVSVDLTAFPPEPGFLVKRDAAGVDTIAFVPAAHVTGKVERPVLALALWGALTFSALGALLPLVAIVLTHGRRGGRGGAARGPSAGACGECKGPLDASLDFCPRCGAHPWRRAAS